MTRPTPGTIGMKIKDDIAALLLIGTSLVFSNWAHATLIGDTVTCAITGQFDPLCSPSNTAIVGNGVEFVITEQNTVNLLAIDIDDSSILISTMGNTLGFLPNDRLTLSDFDWLGMPAEIVGISNFMTSRTSKLSVDDITFTSDSITLDLSSSFWFHFGEDAFVKWEIVTQNVPSPTTLAMFSLGLVGLWWSKREAQRN